MNTLKITFIALIITGFGYAQNKMSNNIDNSNIALSGYSPVSYLDLGLAQKGDKDFKSEHEKVVYYFTSEEQKQMFDKSPKKYLPKYGGFCAFGIYAGAKFRVDPTKFITKNGEYYLFLSDVELDAKQLWLAEKNHDKLEKTADQNWTKLSKTHN